MSRNCSATGTGRSGGRPLPGACGTRIDLVVSEPIEDLQNIESWWARRLRIAFPVLGACKDESAVAELITAAVPRMERAIVVQIGLGQPAGEQPIVPRQHTGPRIGRRVPAGELRLLRGS